MGEASTTDTLLVEVHALMRRTFTRSIAPLEAGEAPPPWTDGHIAIPRACDPRRVVWDGRFLRATLDYFGRGLPGFEVVLVSTDETRVVHANGIRNHDRFELYRSMLAAGEPVPPIYVEPSAQGLLIRDGNHRTYAARAEGIPFLVGVKAATQH